MFNGLFKLERDGNAGDEAKFRELFKIDVSHASDFSKIESLSASGLPAGVEAVTKVEWLNFLDPRFNPARRDMPEKIEGLALGPVLADGRQTLVVTTDDDLKAEEPRWFWVFKVDGPASSAVVPAATSKETRR